MSEPLPPADADFQELAAISPIPTDSLDNGENIAYQEDFADGQELPSESMSETVKVGNANLPKSYDVALAMQRILQDRISDPDCPDSDKSRLVLAWDKLEDRKRILRGRPLPGSLSHTSGSSKRSVAPPLTIIDLPDAKSA